MNVLFDWFSLSFSFNKMPFDTLILLLNIPLENYEMSLKNYFSYTKIYYFAGVKIWTDFKNDKCLLEISGKGCRCLEEFGLDDWEYFYILFADIGAHFNRIDLAMDIKDTLEYKKVIQSVVKKKYITKMYHLIYIEGSEQSIYTGSPKSNKRLRIYNKALERGVDGNWVRFELQLRAEACITLTEYFKQGHSFTYIYSGMINNFIRFVTKTYNNNHADRFITAKWWSNILSTLEKLPDITIGKLEYNLERLETYLQVQAASSLRTLVAYYDGDISKVLEIVSNAKLNTHQQAFLDIKNNTGV